MLLTGLRTAPRGQGRRGALTGESELNSTPQALAIDEAGRDLAVSILHFIERSVGARAVAEDLLQETLIRMHRGGSSFAGRSSAKTWAFSIARHVVADYLRHPDRARRIVALDDAEEPIDPAQGVGERMVEQEMNACVRAVIDTLPEAFRAALILHDLEGLSAQQTAEVCDCTVATAKIRVHRARRRLKEALTLQCSFYHDTEGAFRCDRKP